MDIVPINTDNFVDQIICIGQRGSDRTNRGLRRISNEGLDVHLFDAHMKKNHRDGCWSSHTHVWQESKQKGCKRILVFEDDVVFIHPFLSNLPYLEYFISSVNNWSFLFLGCLPLQLERTNFPHISRVQAYDLHAYIINLEHQAVGEMLKLDPWLFNFFHRPIDVFVSLQASCYTLTPLIAVQETTFSNELLFLPPGTCSSNIYRQICMENILTDPYKNHTLAKLTTKLFLHGTQITYYPRLIIFSISMVFVFLMIMINS